MAGQGAGYRECKQRRRSLDMQLRGVMELAGDYMHLCVTAGCATSGSGSMLV